jgi:hypothetical protein
MLHNLYFTLTAQQVRGTDVYVSIAHDRFRLGRHSAKYRHMSTVMAMCVLSCDVVRVQRRACTAKNYIEKTRGDARVAMTKIVSVAVIEAPFERTSTIFAPLSPF